MDITEAEDIKERWQEYTEKVKVKVTQSCFTLCNFMHCTIQARRLELVAFPFSRGSS